MKKSELQQLIKEEYLKHNKVQILKSQKHQIVSEIHELCGDDVELLNELFEKKPIEEETVNEDFGALDPANLSAIQAGVSFIGGALVLAGAAFAPMLGSYIKQKFGDAKKWMAMAKQAKNIQSVLPADAPQNVKDELVNAFKKAGIPVGNIPPTPQPQQQKNQQQPQQQQAQQPAMA